MLGLAGAVAQGLFRNPLADPFLLGSASGASLGVALALAAMGGGAGMLGGSMMNGAAVSVFSGSALVRLGLTGAAFVGAVLAVLLTLALSRGVQHTLRLLLAGVVVGVVLAALTHLVLVFSPESLQAMQAFMLGSTSFVGWTACLLMAGVWVLCALAAWLFARVLDGLSLGDATARSLGLPLGPMRAALVGVLALATGTAVAQTGLIAFVGLAAPHLVRSLVKTTSARLMLLASCNGRRAAHGGRHAGALADRAAGVAGGRAHGGAGRGLSAVADAAQHARVAGSRARERGGPVSCHRGARPERTPGRCRDPARREPVAADGALDQHRRSQRCRQVDLAQDARGGCCRTAAVCQADGPAAGRLAAPAACAAAGLAGAERNQRRRPDGVGCGHARPLAAPALVQPAQRRRSRRRPACAPEHASLGMARPHARPALGRRAPAGAAGSRPGGRAPRCC